MGFSAQSKTLVVVAIIILVIYLLYSKRLGSFFSKSEGYAQDASAPSASAAVPVTASGDYLPKNDYAPPELKQKFDGRNKSTGGYKNVSYSKGIRGNLGGADWENYFEQNNNVIGNSETGDNDQFMPVDEAGNTHAVFKSKGAPCGSNQNCEPEQLYDIDKLLPQEVNNDWFEVAPEPISVKNRHLINITKPIGIDTIGTSKKNASYDLRSDVLAPKFVVSPWLQSSIEPDTNLKPLY